MSEGGHVNNSRKNLRIGIIEGLLSTPYSVAVVQEWKSAPAAALPPGWNVTSDGTAGGTFYIAPDGTRHWKLPQ